MGIKPIYNPLTGELDFVQNLVGYIPYVGATANLNMGVYGITANDLTIPSAIGTYTGTNSPVKYGGSDYYFTGVYSALYWCGNASGIPDFMYDDGTITPIAISNFSGNTNVSVFCISILGGKLTLYSDLSAAVILAALQTTDPATTIDYSEPAFTVDGAGVYTNVMTLPVCDPSGTTTWTNPAAINQLTWVIDTGFSVAEKTGDVVQLGNYTNPTAGKFFRWKGSLQIGDGTYINTGTAFPIFVDKIYTKSGGSIDAALGFITESTPPDNATTTMTSAGVFGANWIMGTNNVINGTVVGIWGDISSLGTGTVLAASGFITGLACSGVAGDGRTWTSFAGYDFNYGRRGSGIAKETVVNLYQFKGYDFTSQLAYYDISNLYTFYAPNNSLNADNSWGVYNLDRTYLGQSPIIADMTVAGFVKNTSGGQLSGGNTILTTDVPNLSGTYVTLDQAEPQTIINGAPTISLSDLKTTATDGFKIINPTLADVVNTVQNSPDLYFKSNCWSSTAVASKTNEWKIFSQGVTGTTGSSNIVFQHSLAGATYTQPFTFSSGGTLSAGSFAATTQCYVSRASTTNSWTATTYSFYSSAASAASNSVKIRLPGQFMFATRLWNGSASELDYWFTGVNVPDATPAAVDTFTTYSFRHCTASAVMSELGYLGSKDPSASGIRDLNYFNPEVIQSGVAGANAWVIDLKQTSKGTGVYNILDLRVGTASKFRVTDTGAVVLSAGSTAALTAPIKFASGNLMTVPEAGAMEFYNDKFYLTRTTGPIRAEVPTYGIYYIELYSNGNSTATIIEEASSQHALYSLAFLNNTGDHFTPLVGTTDSIASVADYSATVPGTILVTVTAGHNLTTDDYITVHGTTNYNGIYKITTVDTTTFYVTKAYVSSQTGSYTRGHRITLGTGDAGIYSCSLHVSVSPATTGKNWAFQFVVNGTTQDSSYCLETIDTAGHASISKTSLISLADGDVIWAVFKNQSDGTNITIRDLSIVLTRT